MGWKKLSILSRRQSRGGRAGDKVADGRAGNEVADGRGPLKIACHRYTLKTEILKRFRCLESWGVAVSHVHLYRAHY